MTALAHNPNDCSLQCAEVECACCIGGVASKYGQITLPELTENHENDCDICDYSEQPVLLTNNDETGCVWQFVFVCPTEDVTLSATFVLQCSQNGDVNATLLMSTAVFRPNFSGTTSKTWQKTIGTTSVDCNGLTVDFGISDIVQSGTTGVGGPCAIGDTANIQF